jgi:carboxymethylenebutenolidase
MIRALLLTTLFSLTASILSATTTLEVVPGADKAQERLKASPRQGKWANILVPGTTTTLKSWVVYPATTTKAPVVIVIHEIFGLSDWVRVVADQLAVEGFIAIAPDLLSGRGPLGGGTATFANQGDVTKAVRGLDNDFVTSALNAVRDYGLKLPTSSGKIATVGFCWGGTTSFRYATLQPGLNAAVVYYGSSPGEGYERIQAVVLGMYGGNDNRVNSTIPTARQKMDELKKPYVVKVFEGASHGFLRQQDAQGGANLKAAQEAWPATIEFLREHTR